MTRNMTREMTTGLAPGRWRVALVTTFYPPYHFGGDGVAVRHLAGALARRGHDVTVVHDTDAYRTLAPGEPDEAARAAADEAAPRGVRVVALRSRAPALSTLVTQQTGGPGLKRRALGRALAGRFDVVHFHNVSLVGGPGALALGDAAAKLYTAHEHWLVCPTHVLWRHGRERCDARACTRCVLRQRRPPQLWRYTGAVARALAHVDVVVAQSEFSRRRHAEFGLARPMTVLPPFLPDVPATPLGTADAPPHPRPYVLFVGRLEPMKGLADVVPLFGRDCSAGGADLLVAGDGPERAALKALAAGNPRVRFLGRLGGTALDAAYRHAAAVVVPTLGYETFGLVLIEAFRLGVPVVARRLGPLPEVVEASGAGSLFETRAELDAALAALVRDPARRHALGARGAAAFAERWSERAVLPRYEALVERAAGAHAHRAAAPAYAAEFSAPRAGASPAPALGRPSASCVRS